MKKGIIDHLGIGAGLKEVMSLFKQVPKDGEIPAEDAVVLEVKFWQMKTKLTDMYAKAKRYELSIKQQRDNALIDIGSEAEVNSVAGKEQYAKGDERWRVLQEQAKEAEVIREFLELKREDFEQAIYVMRSILHKGLKDKESMPVTEI